VALLQITQTKMMDSIRDRLPNAFSKSSSERDKEKEKEREKMIEKEKDKDQKEKERQHSVLAQSSYPTTPPLIQSSQSETSLRTPTKLVYVKSSSFIDDGYVAPSVSFSSLSPPKVIGKNEKEKK
jgi:hypothetical protein